ncbi:MAG: type II CAAX endopeptidase family protein [Haloarcula sp.]
MRALRDITDRHPVATFAVLAIAVSWTVWIPALSAIDGPAAKAALIPGAFGPLVAGAVVTRMRGDSVRAWLASTLSWRRSGRWYVAAVTLPLAVALGLGGVMVVLAGGFGNGTLRPAIAVFAFNMVFATVLGGGQEEFGWRGFALPSLQARYDALTASLIVGLMWALWHAPLFVFDVYAMNAALYAVSVLAFAVVLTWLYNSSRACVPAAILMHGSINASVNLPLQAVGGPSALPVPFAGLLAGGFGLVAIALIAYYGPQTLSARDVMTPTWTDRTAATAESALTAVQTEVTEAR